MLIAVIGDKARYIQKNRDILTISLIENDTYELHHCYFKELGTKKSFWLDMLSLERINKPIIVIKR